MLVGARLITRLIDMATLLVLARILLPTDFGLFAIAMSVVAVVEAALEIPLNQALLRLPVISKAQYDTAFTLSALRALLMSSILLLAAWPFAWFYDDYRLFPLVCILAIGANARGLTSPRLAEYQKSMSFWRDFAIELTGKSIGFTAAVAMALLTRSYWSIVAGAVVYPVTVMIASYCLAPYRPRFSLSQLPLFSGFVGWMSAAQVINAVNWQSERLLLGKLQPTSQLGLFTTASDISNIPMLALFGPITRPLLAAFSHVRDDKDRLSRSYQTASAAILTIGLPLLVGESLLAEPAIRLVLGDIWLGAVPLLQGLALSLIPALFALPAIPLFMSFGQTRFFLQRNSIEFCVKMPLVVIGALKFGFFGIIVARCVSEAAAVFFCIVIVRRLIGLPIRDQLLGSWRSIVGACVMAVPVLLCLRYFGSETGMFDTAIRLVVTAMVGAVAYAVALWGLWLLSGSPPGIESVVMGGLSRFMTKARKPA